jgi:hypothetical protein
MPWRIKEKWHNLIRQVNQDLYILDSVFNKDNPLHRSRRTKENH